MLSAVAAVVVCCLGSWAVLRAKEQHDFFKVVRTYENEYGLTQKPWESLLSTPTEKETLSARHASYSARIELKPRRQVVDGLPVSTDLAFWLKVLVVTDENFTTIRIHIL